VVLYLRATCRKAALAADARPPEEAERIVAEIERRVREDTVATCPPPAGRQLAHPAKKGLRLWPDRQDHIPALPCSGGARPGAYGLQAFFYNSIFFTYSLVLTHSITCPAQKTAFTCSRSHGQLSRPARARSLLRHARPAQDDFRHLALSALLLVITAFLFSHNAIFVSCADRALDGDFFFASSAASSAYLTVSEIFPLEMRALASHSFSRSGRLLEVWRLRVFGSPDWFWLSHEPPLCYLAGAG